MSQMSVVLSFGSGLGREKHAGMIQEQTWQKLGKEGDLGGDLNLLTYQGGLRDRD